jgi:hypothetical protein
MDGDVVGLVALYLEPGLMLAGMIPTYRSIPLSQCVAAACMVQFKHGVGFVSAPSSSHQ